MVVNPADGRAGGPHLQRHGRAVRGRRQRRGAAFDTTRSLPAYERGAILRELSAGHRAPRDEMADIIVTEAGKPIRDALVEVDRAVLTFRLGAEEAERMRGEVSRSTSCRAPRGGWASRAASRSARSRRSARSTSRSTSPRTSSRRPSRRATRSCSSPRRRPAVDATVAEFIEQAGVPAGAVSILPMTRDVGDQMVADDRFKLLTFTGQPAVGWRMKARAGKKKVVLELGGNAGRHRRQVRRPRLGGQARAVIGAFAYAGQVCISVQRMFVHEAIWDEFLGASPRRRPPSRWATRWTPTTDVGPMVDGATAQRTESWVDEAVPAGRQAAARRQGPGDVLPADHPDRRAAHRPGVLATRRSRRWSWPSSSRHG